MADVVDPASLQKVRAFKKEQKALARAAAEAPGNVEAVKAQFCLARSRRIISMRLVAIDTISLARCRI